MLFRNTRIALFASLLTLALAGCQPEGDSLSRGEALYARCAYCHMADGSGNPELAAPAIAGMEAWFVEGELHEFRAGGRGGHYKDAGGMRMRPVAMTLRTNEEVKDVAAYVASMPKVHPPALLTGGNASTGKIKYAPCSTCHGQNGEGMNTDARKIPALAGQNDWYLKTQLHNFNSKIRGADYEEGTDEWMMANVWINTLRQPGKDELDEQAVLDVLAYIQTLGK